jgi:hypothetical protein
MKVTVPRSHVYNFVEMETLGSDPLLMSSIARPLSKAESLSEIWIQTGGESGGERGRRRMREVVVEPGRCEVMAAVD